MRRVTEGCGLRTLSCEALGPRLVRRLTFGTLVFACVYAIEVWPRRYTVLRVPRRFKKGTRMAGPTELWLACEP